MTAQNTKRCPHYQIYSEQLKMDGPPAYLAIRRCMLTERETGRAVAAKLTTASSRENTAEDAAESPESIRVAFGPDLEAIHAPECTVLRCQESCTPCYRLLLLEFGFVTEAGRAREAACLELVGPTGEG